MKKETENCCDDCTRCMQMCTQTMTYCINKGGAYVTTQTMAMLQDCIDICDVTERCMLRSSAMTPKMCGMCAETCAACATMCEKFTNDETMKRCAEMCRKCAETCKAMSKAPKAA